MSLKRIVAAYVRSIRPRVRAELDWLRQQPSLEAAIQCAALAVNSAGNRYSHQRRIRRAALLRARSLLLAAKDDIRRSATFDELFHLVDAVTHPVSGIGELYVYDASLRIGAKLGILPKRVYLHAGTRLGARRLGVSSAGESLPLSAMPAALRSLRPHEIEDLLCIFKNHLGRGPLSTPSLTKVRSWCD